MEAKFKLLQEDVAKMHQERLKVRTYSLISLSLLFLKPHDPDRYTSFQIDLGLYLGINIYIYANLHLNRWRSSRFKWNKHI